MIDIPICRLLHGNTVPLCMRPGRMHVRTTTRQHSKCRDWKRFEYILEGDASPNGLIFRQATINESVLDIERWKTDMTRGCLYNWAANALILSTLRLWTATRDNILPGALLLWPADTRDLFRCLVVQVVLN